MSSHVPKTAAVITQGRCALGQKKPGGNAEDLAAHFGCEASQLVMVNQSSLGFFGVSFFFVRYFFMFFFFFFFLFSSGE